MNTPAQDFEQALTQLMEMYRSLASIREQVMPGGAHNFGLLAEGTLEHIRRLESSVMELGGRREAEEAEAQVWLRIEGTGVSWPEAPSSVLSTFLATLRKGVQAATEWIWTKDLATRPTKQIKQACDLRVTAFQPGSVRIGARLPDPPRGVERDPKLDESAARALVAYLEVALWAGSEAESDELQRKVPEPELRHLLLNEIKRFAPRPRGDVELVEVSGRAVKGRRATLTRAVHARIDRAIDSIQHTETVRHVGELREIDLDKMTFILRNVEHQDTPFDLPCKFGEELLPSAKEALDRRVEIAGERTTNVSRGRTTQLRVTRLVILDDEDNLG